LNEKAKSPKRRQNKHNQTLQIKKNAANILQQLKLISGANHEEAQ